MSKRLPGEGSIRERENGTYEARVTIRQPDGMKTRVSLYGKTQDAVREKLADVLRRQAEQKPAVDSGDTLGAFAARWAETTLVASDRKASTVATYQGIIKSRVVGSELGSKTFRRLKPTDVEEWLLKLRRDGLKPSTIRQTYAVVRAILDTAVRDGKVAANAAVQVRRPRQEREEKRALSVAEARKLIECVDARSPVAGPYIKIATTTGLRRGEMLGLRWADVSFDSGRLNVKGQLVRVGARLQWTTPKTKRAVRAVPLGKWATEGFRELKAWQTAHGIVTDYVFTSRTGNFIEPANIGRAVKFAAVRAELSGVGTHTFRHSAASWWLAAGVPLKKVSDLLGHSSIQMTADVYGHLTDDDRDDAAAAMDKLTVL